MFTVFVIGNIASGKSTVSHYLESLGARLIDLDQLAKSLYIPGSSIVRELGDEFGWDILDADGGIDAKALASRAFETPERTEALNRIVYPVLLQQLSLRVLPAQCCSVLVDEPLLTVVEVSVAASFQDAFGLADEVIAVTAPVSTRRMRALERGMLLEDFESRCAAQPPEDELCALATCIIDNSGPADLIRVRVNDWLAQHGFVIEGGALRHA